MSYVRFIKGLKKDYNPELYNDCIYRCTDAKCNGLVYIFGKAFNLPIEMTEDKDDLVNIALRGDKANGTLISPSENNSKPSYIVLNNESNHFIFLNTVTKAFDEYNPYYTVDANDEGVSYPDNIEGPANMIISDNYPLLIGRSTTRTIQNGRVENAEDEQVTRSILKYIILLDSNGDTWLNTVNADQFHFSNYPHVNGILSYSKVEADLKLPNITQVKYYLSTYIQNVIRRTPNLDYLAPVVKAHINNEGNIDIAISIPNLGHIGSEVSSEPVQYELISYALYEGNDDSEITWRRANLSFQLGPEAYGKTLLVVAIYPRPLYYDDIIESTLAADVYDIRPRSCATQITLPTLEDSDVYVIRNGNPLFFNPMDTADNLKALTFPNVTSEFISTLYNRNISTYIMLLNLENTNISFTFDKCSITSQSNTIYFEWNYENKKRALTIVLNESGNTVSFLESEIIIANAATYNIFAIFTNTLILNLQNIPEYQEAVQLVHSSAGGTMTLTLSKDNISRADGGELTGDFTPEMCVIRQDLLREIPSRWIAPVLNENTSGVPSGDGTLFVQLFMKDGNSIKILEWGWNKNSISGDTINLTFAVTVVS